MHQGDKSPKVNKKISRFPDAFSKSHDDWPFSAYETDQESCLHLPNFLPCMSSTPRLHTLDSGLIKPVHPVLTIPELLDPVFSFLDHRSNGTNACVCKAWSSVALSVLWFDVDLWRLVSLLVPLKQRGDSLYVRQSSSVFHCHVDLRDRNW